MARKSQRPKKTGFFYSIQMFFKSIFTSVKEFFFGPDPKIDNPYNSSAEILAQYNSPMELKDVNIDDDGLVSFPEKLVRQWPLNRDVPRYFHFLAERSDIPSPNDNHNANFLTKLQKRAATLMHVNAERTELFAAKPALICLNVKDGQCTITVFGLGKQPREFTTENPDIIGVKLATLYAETCGTQITLLDKENNTQYLSDEHGTVFQCSPHMYHFWDAEKCQAGVSHKQSAKTVVEITGVTIPSVNAVSDMSQNIPVQKDKKDGNDFYSMITALHSNINAMQQGDGSIKLPEIQNAYLTHNQMVWLTQGEDGLILNAQSTAHPSLPPVSLPIAKEVLQNTQEGWDVMRAEVNYITNKNMTRIEKREAAIELFQDYCNEHPITDQSTHAEHTEFLLRQQTILDKPNEIRFQDASGEHKLVFDARYDNTCGEEKRFVSVTLDKQLLYGTSIDADGTPRAAGLCQTEKDLIQTVASRLESAAEYQQKTEIENQSNREDAPSEMDR